MEQTDLSEARELIDTHKTMQLASLNEDGKPHISYAPFLLHSDGYFYIFISQLAGHYQTINRGTVAAMIINSEQDSKNLFARVRISFDCTVKVIKHDTPMYTEVLEAFAARQGKLVGLLRTLGDFSLMQLQPHTALFVKGFGDAQCLEPHLTELLS